MKNELNIIFLILIIQLIKKFLYFVKHRILALFQSRNIQIRIQRTYKRNKH